MLSASSNLAHIQRVSLGYFSPLRRCSLNDAAKVQQKMHIRKQNENFL